MVAHEARTRRCSERRAVPMRRHREPAALEQGREHIGDVLVLATDPSVPVDALGPREDARHRVTARVRVDLVEPPGCVAEHRPTPRVVRRRGRAADLVDASQVRLDVVALEEMHVVRRRPGRLAFTRRPVVGDEEEDRVLQLPHLVERAQHAPDVLVEVVDHARVDGHVPREAARARHRRGRPTRRRRGSSSVLRGGSGRSAGMTPSSC